MLDTLGLAGFVVFMGGFLGYVVRDFLRHRRAVRRQQVAVARVLARAEPLIEVWRHVAEGARMGETVDVTIEPWTVFQAWDGARILKWAICLDGHPLLFELTEVGARELARSWGFRLVPESTANGHARTAQSYRPRLTPDS
jgi:hypothetical protein